MVYKSSAESMQMVYKSSAESMQGRPVYEVGLGNRIWQKGKCKYANTVQTIICGECAKVYIESTESVRVCLSPPPGSCVAWWSSGRWCSCRPIVPTSTSSWSHL